MEEGSHGGERVSGEAACFLGGIVDNIGDVAGSYVDEIGPDLFDSIPNWESAIALVYGSRLAVTGS